MWVTRGGATVAIMPLFWCCVIIGSSLMRLCHGQGRPYDYPRRVLDKFDVQSYAKFITGLRSALPKSGVKYEASVLSKAGDERNRFVRVDLRSGNKEITLALYAPDAYVFGFVANGVYYYFEEATEMPRDEYFRTFDRRQYRMDEGVYQKLEGRTGGKKRETIPLGVENLKLAVELLADNPTDINQQALSMLVIIQMVSEALRYNHLFAKFKEPSFNSAASASMTSYENAWGKLSRQIMRTSDGRFKKTVTLISSDTVNGKYVEVTVRSVRDKELQGKLALIKDTE